MTSAGFDGYVLASESAFLAGYMPYSVEQTKKSFGSAMEVPLEGMDTSSSVAHSREAAAKASERPSKTT